MRALSVACISALILVALCEPVPQNLSSGPGRNRRYGGNKRIIERETSSGNSGGASRYGLGTESAAYSSSAVQYDNERDSYDREYDDYEYITYSDNGGAGSTNKDDPELYYENYGKTQISSGGKKSSGAGGFNNQDDISNDFGLNNQASSFDSVGNQGTPFGGNLPTGGLDINNFDRGNQGKSVDSGYGSPEDMVNRGIGAEMNMAKNSVGGKMKMALNAERGVKNEAKPSVGMAFRAAGGLMGLGR